MDPSNYFCLTCYTQSNFGILERVLRVIRVRGFTVEHLQCELVDEGYELNLQLSGAREPANLMAHLANIEDVTHVEPSYYRAQAPLQNVASLCN